MDAQKASYSIALMARVLGVTRAGYYAWKSRASHRGERALVRRRLDEAVAWEYEVSGGTYGAPRISHALMRAGVGVGCGQSPRRCAAKVSQGACQFFCVWGLEVGGDSVGVGGGELGEGLFPVGGGVSLDEAGVSCSFVGGFASVCEALGGAFVFDVADGEP